MAAAAEEEAVEQDPQYGDTEEDDEAGEASGATWVGPVERLVDVG